ncbi:hypothetical protein VNO77_01405 [Canavalia gladiata]|uniref:Uncharacterized protein n=1 Tax=Canavalia gladiata TaxID=3824 RepID=A0AAN9MR59_CANGL
MDPLFYLCLYHKLFDAIGISSEVVTGSYLIGLSIRFVYDDMETRVSLYYSHGTLYITLLQVHLVIYSQLHENFSAAKVEHLHDQREERSNMLVAYYNLTELYLWRLKYAKDATYSLDKNA